MIKNILFIFSVLLIFGFSIFYQQYKIECSERQYLIKQCHRLIPENEKLKRENFSLKCSLNKMSVNQVSDTDKDNGKI